MALIQLPYGEGDWYDFDRRIGVVVNYSGGECVALVGFSADPIDITDSFETTKEAHAERDEIAQFINQTLCTQNKPIIVTATDALRALLNDAQAAAQKHPKDHPIHNALSEVKILIAHGRITNVSDWQLDTLRRHVLAASTEPKK